MGNIGKATEPCISTASDNQPNKQPGNWHLFGSPFIVDNEYEIFIDSCTYSMFMTKR